MIDQRRLELGVNVATGLVAASVVVALVRFVLVMGEEPSTPPVAPVVRGASTSVGFDISPILRVAPFGSSAPVAMTAAPGGGFVLRGVILARPQSASSAWISGGDGRARAFRIGDDVGGAVLAGVGADHVVLRTATGTETLGFPKASAATDQGVASILAGMPTSVTAAAPVPLPPPPPPPPPSAASAAPSLTATPVPVIAAPAARP